MIDDTDFPQTHWVLGLDVQFLVESPFPTGLRMESFLQDLYRIAIDNDVCITITRDDVITEFQP